MASSLFLRKLATHRGSSTIQNNPHVFSHIAKSSSLSLRAQSRNNVDIATVSIQKPTLHTGNERFHSAVKVFPRENASLNFLFSPTTTTNSVRTMSSISSSSSSEGGFFSRIRGKFNDRAERSKAQKMTEQLEKMTNLEVWTLGSFVDDLESSMSDWKTKIPGMGMTSQVTAMKESMKVMNAIISKTGKDATADDFAKLGRRDKLKIALEGDCSIEDLNSVISQFQSMQIMHRVLRYRKSKGKPLPKDEKSMQSAIKEDGNAVLTKKEKKDLMMMHRSRGMKGLR